MNCKQGDLAIVKNVFSANYGRIVLVLHRLTKDQCRDRGFSPLGDVLWLVESIGEPLLCERGEKHHQRPFSDGSLRPIRDPGDDAVDETLQRLGSPNEVTA